MAQGCTTRHRYPLVYMYLFDPHAIQQLDGGVTVALDRSNYRNFDPRRTAVKPLKRIRTDHANVANRSLHPLNRSATVPQLAGEPRSSTKYREAADAGPSRQCPWNTARKGDRKRRQTPESQADPLFPRTHLGTRSEWIGEALLQVFRGCKKGVRPIALQGAQCDRCAFQ
jgi:hypothetical protein